MVEKGGNEPGRAAASWSQWEKGALAGEKEILRGQIRGRWPCYPPEDEHLVRRIGYAVTLFWNALPEELQSLIVMQAIYVDDRYQTVQLEPQVKQFLRRWSQF